MRKVVLFMVILLCQIPDLASQDLIIDGHPANEIFKESLIYGNPSNAYELEIFGAAELLHAGKIDSALKVSAALIQQAELGLLPPEQTVDAYKNMGRILLKINVQDLAQWYLEKAHHLYKGYHFKPSGYSAELYSLLASNYILYYNKPEKAIAYYNKSRAIYKHLENHLYEASLTNNIGFVYLENGRLDSALFYFEQALKILKTNNVPLEELMLSINNNLGDVAYQMKKFEKALNYYELNNQLALGKPQAPIRHDYRLVTSNIGRAKVCFAMGQYERGEDYLIEAENKLPPLRYSDQLDLKISIESLKEVLYKYYDNFEAFEEASKTKILLLEKRHKIEVDAQSQVNGELVELQLNSFNKKLDAKQKELQIANAEKRFYILLIFGLLLIFLLVGTVLILLLKKRTAQRNKQMKLLAVNVQNQLEQEKTRYALHK